MTEETYWHFNAVSELLTICCCHEHQQSQHDKCLPRANAGTNCRGGCNNIHILDSHSHHSFMRKCKKFCTIFPFYTYISTRSNVSSKWFVSQSSIPVKDTLASSCTSKSKSWKTISTKIQFRIAHCITIHYWDLHFSSQQQHQLGWKLFYYFHKEQKRDGGSTCWRITSFAKLTKTKPHGSPLFFSRKHFFCDMIISLFLNKQTQARNE